MTRLPLARDGNSTCASAGGDERIGDAGEEQRDEREAQRDENDVRFHDLHRPDELEDDVDELDADERRDDAADAVDEQRATQQRRRAERPVLHAAQRQRDRAG